MSYSIFDETMVNMPWTAVERAVARGAVVLMPLGIIEEHGPHMGLAVDMFAAHLLSTLTRRHLEKQGIEALISPPNYWGVSPATAAFAGTFSVREETMAAIIHDIVSLLCRWHFRRVFVINWHADHRHCRTALDALSKVRAETGMDVRYLITPQELRRFRLSGDEPHILVRRAPPSMESTGRYADYHAGSMETGVALAYFPEHVDEAMARKLEATRLTDEDLRNLGRSDEETRKLIPGGYFGNPAGYDIVKAKAYIEANALDLAGTIAAYLKSL
ncbi:MAG: creatininase family protein [Dehalococcoidales bacterium]|nr:creatininase family protein [Dehalococcoidales bacterium]